MNKNSPEIIELKKQVEERIGRKIRTPKDFDFLRSHIWENNKEIISPTTLKRLWGYIGGADRARPGTLDILSRAAGFKDWDDFLGNLNPEGASDAIKAYHISTEALQAGNRLKVSWQPDRCCTFRYLGNSVFIVEQADNSKLQPGDTFCASIFILGEPMYLSNLIQGDRPPVPFVAGSRGGLCELKLL